MGVSSSERYWQRIIDAYYEKYQGIKEWHIKLLDDVRRHGRLEIPSGRIYYFSADTSRGYPRWPETKIKNYPVQGFGADLVMLARIELLRIFNSSGGDGKFISTVHDSLVLDIPSEICYTIRDMLKSSVESVPRLCKEKFGYDFNLPLTCEVLAGPNMKDLEEI
jgi:DNA polymerase I-like protein with 3'-5' exonuclease and polymerase domains